MVNLVFGQSAVEEEETTEKQTMEEENATEKQAMEEANKMIDEAVENVTFADDPSTPMNETANPEKTQAENN